MDSRMATLSAALEDAGGAVRWAPGVGAAPDEGHLLAGAGGLAVVDRLLTAEGFAEVPGAGKESRYLRWDGDAGRFVVLHAAERVAAGQGATAAGGPAAARRRRGLSVALLGPDGSGKSTLAAGIAEAFPLPVVQVYMGLWKSGSDRPGLQLLDAVLRPFRAVRRYLVALGHQARGRLVVFDRFTYDARLPPGPPAVTAKRIYFWLLARVCPAPDLVLLLDVPGAVSFARKGENSAETNEAQRRQFLALAAELDLHVLDASQPPDAVRRDALEVIWAAYRLRWSGERRVPVAAAAG